MIETKTHVSDLELADFLSGNLNPENKKRLEGHLVGCPECLTKMVSVYESVSEFKKIRKVSFMKNVNIYLVLAIISFALSFALPQYFAQLLVATLLLGIKWVADSKSTKMLVMIYEAWKKGGEKEASKILEKIDSRNKRF